MNKPDLIEFAKQYLGVQTVPRHIELLLEGMSYDGRNRRIFSQGTRGGKNTARKIVSAYACANKHDMDDSQRTTPINCLNGADSEK